MAFRKAQMESAVQTHRPIGLPPGEVPGMCRRRGAMAAARGRWIALVCALSALAMSAPAYAEHLPLSGQEPTASFDMSKTVAVVGESVTFTDTSEDPDGDIATRQWDTNGDGQFTEPIDAREVSRTYRIPGEYRVRLRVTDHAGHTDEDERLLQVLSSQAPPPAAVAPPAPGGAANRPPVASFSFTPAGPRTGQAVSFTSTSSDADGFIASQVWDLNGDGTFDEAGGPTAQFLYSTPGDRTVSLRVTDDKGASTVAFQSFTVVPAEGAAAESGTGVSPSPAPTGSGARARLLSPFPIVRIRGQILPDGARIELLSVRRPAGATVRISCRGRSCPYRVAVARAGRALRVVRFRKLERRLAAGTVLEVRVIKAGLIGKYTRFRIRRGAAPARRDLCLGADNRRPIRCPEQ